MHDRSLQPESPRNSDSPHPPSPRSPSSNTCDSGDLSEDAFELLDTLSYTLTTRRTVAPPEPGVPASRWFELHRRGHALTLSLGVNWLAALGNALRQSGQTPPQEILSRKLPNGSIEVRDLEDGRLFILGEIELLPVRDEPSLVIED